MHSQKQSTTKLTRKSFLFRSSAAFWPVCLHYHNNDQSWTSQARVRFSSEKALPELQLCVCNLVFGSEKSAWGKHSAACLFIIGASLGRRPCRSMGCGHGLLHRPSPASQIQAMPTSLFLLSHPMPSRFQGGRNAENAACLLEI